MMRQLPVRRLALGMLAFAAVTSVSAQSNAQTHVTSVKATEDSILADETAKFFMELTNEPGIQEWTLHNLIVTWSPPGLVKNAYEEIPTNVATATIGKNRVFPNDKVIRTSAGNSLQAYLISL